MIAGFCSRDSIQQSCSQSKMQKCSSSPTHCVIDVHLAKLGLHSVPLFLFEFFWFLFFLVGSPHITNACCLYVLWQNKRRLLNAPLPLEVFSLLWPVTGDRNRVTECLHNTHEDCDCLQTLNPPVSSAHNDARPPTTKQWNCLHGQKTLTLEVLQN